MSPAVFLLLKIVKFTTIENLLWFCANFRIFSIYKNNIVDVLIEIFLGSIDYFGWYGHSNNYNSPDLLIYF